VQRAPQERPYCCDARHQRVWDTSHFHESAGNIAHTAFASSSAPPIERSPATATNSAKLFIQHHNATCIAAAALRATCVMTQFLCLFTCISRRRLRRCSDILVEGTDAANGRARRSRVKDSRARYALLREDRSQTPAIAPIPESLGPPSVLVPSTRTESNSRPAARSQLRAPQ